MTIMTRIDSDGIEHRVWAQRQANSCAIASLMMAESLAKQMSLAEGEWERAKALYRNIFPWKPQGPSAPMTLDPDSFLSNQNTFENMFAKAGTYPRQIVGALKRRGLKVDIRSGTRISLISSRITSSTPVIVGVYWRGGGGHAVVATRVASNNRIVFLDPGGGVVNEVPNSGSYVIGNSNGSIGCAIYVSYVSR